MNVVVFIFAWVIILAGAFINNVISLVSADAVNGFAIAHVLGWYILPLSAVLGYLSEGE